MKITLNILGFEAATLEVDLGEPVERQLPVLDRGIKKLSNFWVRRMNS